MCGGMTPVLGSKAVPKVYKYVQGSTIGILVGSGRGVRDREPESRTSRRSTSRRATSERR